MMRKLPSVALFAWFWLWPSLGVLAVEEPSGVEAVKRVVEEQAQKIQALESQQQSQQKDLEALRAQAESPKEVASPAGEPEDAGPQEMGFSPSLRIFGFYDLSFFQQDYERKSYLEYLLPKNGSFTQTSLNLYVQGFMSERWSSLAELRFSFMPNGSEKGYDLGLLAGGQETDQAGYQYERTDTTYVQPLALAQHRYGSVGIERLHVTFTLTDWLQVMAGRFLTPVGIWNEDHGVTVLVNVRSPHFLWENKFFPTAQTGLQLRGRGFPLDVLKIDYALTLSNGRGPMDSLADLDNNKAVGGRLRVTYETSRLVAAVGGSGYFGDFRDIRKKMLVDVVEQKPSFVTETVESYTEWNAGLDARVELLGLTLIGEYVYRHQDNSVARLMDTAAVYELTGNLLASGTTLRVPDYSGHAFNLLLAYALPLRRWLGSVRLTPYLLYDYYEPEDYIVANKNRSLDVGLNVMFTPQVFLKVEVDYTWLPSKHFSNNHLIAYIAQLAVSF